MLVDMGARKMFAKHFKWFLFCNPPHVLWNRDDNACEA